jgi:hypothetical protein
MRRSFLTGLFVMCLLHGAAFAEGQQFLQVSAGLGITVPLVEDTDAEGLGFYGDAEYIYAPVPYLSLRGHAGLLITATDGDTCAEADPCDVSAQIFFLGGKFRLMAPIPWFGPFLELGIGLSAGSLVTRVDGLANERLKGLTYHIPVSVGFAIGRNHEFEVVLSALYHPAPRNAGGALAVGISVPLD